jgi:hypothetical protein
MTEAIKFEKCFGHAISETDEIKNVEDVIEKFNAREKCRQCEEAYNCLSLASMQAGYGNDEIIEKYLQGLKLNALVLRQLEKISSDPLFEQSSENLQKLTFNFIDELNKDENQKLKQTLIEQMTKQYEFLISATETIKDFLQKLGGFNC